MTKADKELLLQIVKDFHDETKKGTEYSEREGAQVAELIGAGYLNGDAFSDGTVLSARFPIFLLKRKSFPLTALGYEFIHRDWYTRFQRSPWFRFMRDILAIVGTIAVILEVYRVFAV